ncbi:MAG: haloacid dehalogenase type II [Dehalococcoidia bacterium]|nr:haloacid dehalogenase type II [Dehalococcoidia bacterium]
MLDFNRFQWVSFDCYGTLVDWETGISGAVDEVLESHGVRMSRGKILRLFADVEPRVQVSEGFLKYRKVLRRVMELIGRELRIELSESELGCLADTLPDWPVFPDTVEALRVLKERYRLAVISNVDDDLFAGTAEALEVEFDAVVTAEQVGSYKPDMRNFEVAKERMGIETERWLHVAESRYHDIGPANRLGIASVWVNRADRGGGTRRSDAVPDVEVPGLWALARMACAV